MNRCTWAQGDEMIQYHDFEWGIPVHDEKKLFEMLILEGAQAGLSWSTILKRRKTYCAAFDDFDPKKISKYTQKDVTRLLSDEGIIRNRLKIKSTINNAQKFLEIQAEFGSFGKYLWGFVGENKSKIILQNTLIFQHQLFCLTKSAGISKSEDSALLERQ
jgi:DNA-3-methyladenine glycosylase I